MKAGFAFSRQRLTARVSGLVGEPTNETENAFAWTPLFCTAHHQVRLHALLAAILLMEKLVT